MFKIGSEIYFRSKYPDVLVPKDVSLSKFVLEKLKNHQPNNPIIINGTTHREYNSTEVVDLIERSASGFHRLGVKKGDIVCILLSNTPEYIPIFHGAILAGATVSLANPDYTIDELKKTVGMVTPKFLVTSQEVHDRHGGIRSFLPTVEHIILLGNKPIPKELSNVYCSFDSLLENDGKYPNIPIDPMNDIAVIPFSSGTTGLYKGVCLSHYNLITNILQCEAIDGPIFYANDVIIGAIPMFHIYGCMFFLGFFLSLGKKVIMCQRFEPNLYLSLIQKYRVTIAYIVPPLVLFFAKSPLIDKYDLSSLRMILSGAAPLSIELETLFTQRFKNQIAVKVGYGLTETSPVLLLPPLFLHRPGSSGILLPNIIAKVISTDTGKTLGLHERGELCIKCPNVMVGYYNNPVATNDCIRDGFFHTGDICYVDEDGYFFVVDRVKELIKYKGYQVPPAELEGLLLSHPQILDACVVGIADEEGGEVPRAFVVLKPGQEGKITQDDIHKFINSKVSNPKKLRGGIFFISAIPKSATGKLLRKDLKNKL